MTLEEKREAIQHLGNICPICQRERELVTDHDHDTGTIRGFICRDCNLLLGNARNNSKVLRNAASYLEACQETGKTFMEAGERKIVMIRGVRP